MSCLDYIFIKDICTSIPTNGIPINNYVQFSTNALAKLTDENIHTAKELALNILNIAKETTLSNVYNMSSSYQFNSNVLSLKNDYTFNNAPILSDNIKTIIHSNKTSKMLYHKMTNIYLIPMFNGAFDIMISDSTQNVTINATATANQLLNIPVDFSSKDKEFKIELESGKYFSSINQNSSGCSTCGGGKTYDYMLKSIYNNNIYNYPMILLAESSLFCNSENLLCTLITNPFFKNDFAKLVAYNFMSEMYRIALTSPRINSETIDKESIEKDLSKFIEDYNKMLTGNKDQGTKGILYTIKQAISSSQDYCVLCSQKVNKSNMIL